MKPIADFGPEPTSHYLRLIREVSLAADWLLKHGRDFGDWSPLPPRMRAGMPKLCYHNALRVARQGRGRYVYCEGMATNIIPTSHAWCYDRETGLIVDVTWKRGCNYIGVPFQIGYARRHMSLEQGSTPLMNLHALCPVITGQHGPEKWREEI